MPHSEKTHFVPLVIMVKGAADHLEAARLAVASMTPTTETSGARSVNAVPTCVRLPGVSAHRVASARAVTGFLFQKSQKILESAPPAKVVQIAKPEDKPAPACVACEDVTLYGSETCPVCSRGATAENGGAK